MTRAGVVALLFAATGCSEPSYSVIVRFAPDTLAEEAVVVELAVVGGCDVQDGSGGPPRGAVPRSVVLRRGERTAPLGALAPGRYGLYGRGRDADCTVVAAGCVDVDVESSGSGELVVTLAPVEGPGCADGQACATGECRAAVDAGQDAGRDAEVPCVEGEACTLEGVEGVCRAGACCTGCWDGSACLPGTAASACGAGGGECATCACPTNRCEAGACVIARPVQAIAAGFRSTCAIGTDGTMWCWGGNDFGQLGLGDSGEGTERERPEQVGTASDWIYAGAGDDTACGMRADGTAACWGDNSDGHLGLGDTEARSAPEAIPDHTWTVLAAGRNDHNCAFHDDELLWCWGENTFGQLGLGDTTARHEPIQIGTETWALAAPGGDHTCAIRSDGTLWCWGKNDHSELAQGDTTQRETPTQVGTETWEDLWAGYHHHCARRTGGDVLCWGENDDGQLGVGDRVDKGTPTALEPATGWARVFGGRHHTCALRDDATLWCWGLNDDGQLGLGDDEVGNVQVTPVQVGTDAAWVDVAVGQHHTCALREDQTVWCAGRNDLGQLGVGGRESRSGLSAVCF